MSDHLSGLYFAVDTLNQSDQSFDLGPVYHVINCLVLSQLYDAPMYWSQMLLTLQAHVLIQTEARLMIWCTRLHVAFNARLAGKELEARTLRVN